MMSQKETILKELKKGRAVDTVWGFNRNICRLSARIMDLRADGHNIESLPIKREGKTLPYCAYRLKK